MIGRECLGRHLHEGNKGASEIRQISAAPIDDGARRNDDASLGAHNLDRLHDPSPAGDDILSHHKPLTRPNDKPPTQDQPALAIFLHKNMPPPQTPRHFLTHNNAADRWGNHGLCVKFPEAIRQEAAHAGRQGSVLEQQGALKKFPAVETGS